MFWNLGGMGQRKGKRSKFIPIVSCLWRSKELKQIEHLEEWYAISFPNNSRKICQYESWEGDIAIN